MGKMDCPWTVQIHTKTYFKKELKALLLYSFLFLVAIFPLPFLFRSASFSYYF